MRIILFITIVQCVVKRYFTNLYEYKIANKFEITESFFFFC